MKIYDCKNPQQNNLPEWMTDKHKRQEEALDFNAVERERVKQFKQCPDDFFPSFCPPPKPRHDKVR